MSDEIDGTLFLDPTFTEIDADGDFSLEFCFGPQGSPASMRVSVHFFAESGFKPVLWRMGPGRFVGKDGKPDRGFIELPFASSVYLKACLLYGKKIDEHWGKDPYWWRCEPDCTGHKYQDGPPFKVCRKCERIRKEVELATDRWLELNPPPLPDMPVSEPRVESRTITREDPRTFIQVHADGGKCHGTPLDARGQCPRCKTFPDTQSTELWAPSKVNNL